jgi:hypothetical protein
MHVPIGEPLLNGRGEPLVFAPAGNSLAYGRRGGGLAIIHAVPLRDRISKIRRLRELSTKCREMLAPQLAALPAGDSSLPLLARLQDAVLHDQRFAGDLRTAALLVIGEAWDEQILRRDRAQ